MRKSKHTFGMTALLLVAVCLSFLYGHRNDFGLGRNMELAVNMMRELTVSYVDSIDTDKLMAGAFFNDTATTEIYTEFPREGEVDIRGSDDG